jgi:hypothetical protein
MKAFGNREGSTSVPFERPPALASERAEFGSREEGSVELARTPTRAVKRMELMKVAMMEKESERWRGRG